MNFRFSPIKLPSHIKRASCRFKDSRVIKNSDLIEKTKSNQYNKVPPLLEIISMLCRAVFLYDK